MAGRSWNRVELIGNLTRDPEMRYTPNGAAVATFSIATNRTFVSDGEKKEEVDFHRIVAWGKLAELCSQLMKKGNKVFVSGRLQNRSWEDKEGQQRQQTEIILEDMVLLTSKGESEGGYSEQAGTPTRQAEDFPSKPKADKAPTDDVNPGLSDNGGTAKKDEPKKEEVEDLDDLPF